ncbi:hypothetical protein NIES4071_87890 [Calothrix sp. NIES-4071]|nr:hypothetical protein NIES4071_87890 [Calothrix sp. NIES-4071]BAZ63056.1 hypothetical protein NIES4105_87820 [Calothrix sp. NIES-4105]
MNARGIFFGLFCTTLALAPMTNINSAVAVERVNNYQSYGAKANLIAASNFDYPSGYFKDNTWGVHLSYSGGEYVFERTHVKTQQSIASRTFTKSGNKNRQIYTWKKDGYTYRVTYRPQQSNTIRFEVYHPSGQAILNRLLYR